MKKILAATFGGRKEVLPILVLTTLAGRGPQPASQKTNKAIIRFNLPIKAFAQPSFLYIFYFRIFKLRHHENASIRAGDLLSTNLSSWFNTDMLCPDCRQAEALHPLYAYAQQEAFIKAQTGNYCFTGIGLPQDLQRQYLAA
jgi:hypothetical protein